MSPRERSPNATAREPTRELDASDEHDTNRLVTVMAALLVLTVHAGMLIALILGVGYHPVRLPLRVGILALVGVITWLLLVRRRAVSEMLYAGAFTAMVLPFVVTFWLNESSYVAAGRLGTPWELFLGPKMLLFVVAALCPSRPRWLAPALLTIFVSELIVFWFAFDLGAPGAPVSAREPWLVVHGAALAVLLLFCRLHHTHRERQLAAARADAAILRTTNEAFIAVQDLANTPIQNLEIVLSLMAQRGAEEPLLRNARRSVARLRELSRLLPVKHVTSASLDSRSLDRIRELRDAAE